MLDLNTELNDLHGISMLLNAIVSFDGASLDDFSDSLSLLNKDQDRIIDSISKKVDKYNNHTLSRPIATIENLSGIMDNDQDDELF